MMPAKKNIYLSILFSLSAWAASAQTLSYRQVDSLMKEARQLVKAGDKAPSDPAKYFSLLQPCAQNGHAGAMYGLAECFVRGWGTGKDTATAIEWFGKAGDKNIPKAWYRIGSMYKQGIAGAEPDYDKAYINFCKAADRDVEQAVFMKGYMLYTGLGCTQNYEAAYPLFQKAAAKKNGDAMRFLGLCMRHGYGTAVNTDSAAYWSHLSDKYSKTKYDSMYHVLKSYYKKNPRAGISLFEKIKQARALVKNGNPVNTYTRISHSVAANEIEGTYEGWLLKYDWSGKHIINADKIKMELVYRNDSLQGWWTQNDTVRVELHAMLTPRALVFSGMEYNKRYSLDVIRPELVQFENARLQMVKDKDSSYLCGDVQLYYATRKEPAKPMYLALVRTAGSNSNKNIQYVNDDGSPLSSKAVSAYPNPFSNTINLDFELKKNSAVQVKLFSLDGKLVFSNAAQQLAAGTYTIPLQPQQLPGGTYVLQLVTGKKINTIKVIRER